MNNNWEYDVKCRKCNKVTRMFHSAHHQTSADTFKKWASEHSKFPIKKQCSCDNGMIMFHDLIAFGNALSLIIEQ